MNVKELSEKCGLKILTDGEALKREVTNGYCGDLLSWVIGRAPEKSAWVTVMGNENAVAVALLADISCIILAQSATADEKALERAKENNIAVLATDLGAYETAIKIYEVLKAGH